MQQQLDDKTEEAARASNNLHDAKVVINQHVIAESARAGQSNPLPEQTQQQYTFQPEATTAGGKPQSNIFKEPLAPPPRKVKKVSAREAALALEIDSEIQGDMQWIFKMDREQRRENLPGGWTTSAPLHPAIKMVLNSTTLPLWAAVPPCLKNGQSSNKSGMSWCLQHRKWMSF